MTIFTGTLHRSLSWARRFHSEPLFIRAAAGVTDPHISVCSKGVCYLHIERGE
jgi:hypothetical protein